MNNMMKNIENISLHTPVRLTQETKELLKNSINYKEEFEEASIFIWESYLKYLNRVPDLDGYFSNIDNLLLSNVDRNTVITNLKSSEEYKNKNKIPDVNSEKYVEEYILQNKTNILEGFSVKFYAPFGTSGYSDAVLDYIYFITLNGGIVSFIPTDLQGRVDDSTAKDIKYQIAISCMYKDIAVDNIWIYTTPLVWEAIVKIEKANNINVATFGMYIWETDNLRQEVVDGMNNSVDTILVASEYNVDIFKKYVNKPLYCIHHVIRLINPDIKINVIKENKFLKNLHELSKTNFIFYVIAHWNPRKDIDKLLESFSKAFSKNDNVKLVVKTFLHSHGKENNNKLESYIEEKYNNKNILLNFDLMTIDEIQELHKICNCFVSTSHSEGVGFSVIISSMLNQVMAPNFSGYMDYIKDIQLVKHETVNVDLNYPPIYRDFERYYPDYKSDMKWVGVDSDDLTKQLKNTCNKVKESNINKIHIANNFSYNNILGEVLYVFNSKDIYKKTIDILERFINQEVEFNILRTYVKTLFRYEKSDLYEKACAEMRKIYDIPEMHYVFQYFESDNSERQYEMDFSLENILINPLITKVHCLSEKEYNFNNFDLVDKINQVIVKDRLTFKYAFDYCNSNLINKICIFANNDIYFDSTLYYLTQLNNLDKFMVALSRYDYDIKTHGLKSFTGTNDGVHEYSQDVWAFKTPIQTTKEMEFFQGVQGCDNRIVYLFNELGYYIVNPCETIRIVHMHTSEVRNPITNSKKTRFDTNLRTVRSTNISVLNNIQKLFGLYFNREATIEEFSTILKEIDIYKKEHTIDMKFVRKILVSVIEDRSYTLLVDILKDSNVTVTQELDKMFKSKINVSEILNKCVYNKREYLENNSPSIISNCNKKFLKKNEVILAIKCNTKLKDLIETYKNLSESSLKNRFINLFENKFKFSPNLTKINKMYNLYLNAKSNNIDAKTLEEIIFDDIVSSYEIIENGYINVLGRSLDKASLNEQEKVLKIHGIEGYYKILYNSDEFAKLGKKPYLTKMIDSFLM